jgi:hypothetical protein
MKYRIALEKTGFSTYDLAVVFLGADQSSLFHGTAFVLGDFITLCARGKKASWIYSGVEMVQNLYKKLVSKKVSDIQEAGL